MNSRSSAFWPAVVVLFALPAGHPLLIPLVGVPSHLLWWVHVLPVALVGFNLGRRAGIMATLVSTLAVVVGERLFGAGYGVAADGATIAALGVALLLTNALVTGFSLYARGVSRRYRALFDSANSAILRVDGYGNIRVANPAAVRVLGIDHQLLQGRNLRDVTTLSGLPEISELASGGWSGTLSTGPEQARRELHLVVTAIPDDDPPGYQLILVDRTTEVAQEREIERQTRLSTLGEALAGAAHELKTPLQIILAYAELGLDGPETPDAVRKDLVGIQEQGHRMRDMVQELLGFSRSRQQTTTFELHEVVGRAVRMQRMAHGAGIDISEQVLWQGSVEGNAARVEQILANLLGNAADAVHPGSGRVVVEVDTNDDRARVTVRDNGPGIAPAIRDRLFEPFATTKPEGRGTGLGLAISRRLALSMGGDLSVTDGAGGGAAFCLGLPLASPASGKP